MKVAVAVITDALQRFLIVRRAKHLAHGGMWEFPGGKLEIDELPAAALIREIKEEVGLDIIHFDFLGEVTHSYNGQSICLLVYLVNQFEGEAWCCESQMDLLWVDFASLKHFEFPAANVDIIKLIEASLLLSQ